MSMIDFHSLAKTELHCHLDGSLSLPTIRQLAALANIDLPASDEELKHHVTAPAHCENLLDYLEAFDYIRPLWKMSSTSRSALHQNCPWTKDSLSQKPSMLSAMVCAKPRMNLALLQKP